jgi:aspartate 1-decarboxylase
VTDINVDYEGSITLGAELMDRPGYCRTSRSTVIVIAYAECDEREMEGFVHTVVRVDGRNQSVEAPAALSARP